MPVDILFLGDFATAWCIGPTTLVLRGIIRKMDIFGSFGSVSGFVCVASGD